MPSWECQYLRLVSNAVATLPEEVMLTIYAFSACCGRGIQIDVKYQLLFSCHQ